MPTLITVKQLRCDFPFVIDKDVDDGQLKFSLAAASRRLEGWIGADVYADALAEAETEMRKQTLKHAEGHLAMHFALLGLNTHLRSFGLVKTEQVEGESNPTTVYFNPNDTANFVTQYLEMAREIAEPYLLSDGTPQTGFEVVTDGS